jgi:2-(1,2-epoxy-1,2-dihydrophenyl)acetyl-CoA isomerase
MPSIEVERYGGVGRLTINRPHRLNAFDLDTAVDFRRAGLQLSRDTAVRAVVLRGLPGVFCSGADLKAIREGCDATDGLGAGFKAILEYLHSTISEIRRAPKPFIAAVDGIAAAGGFGIAMSCDLVIASSRASFEWAYGKTGLTGAESATFFLPRLVGLRGAMELAFVNPRLNAREALRRGLITEVYDGEDFDAYAMEKAAQLAAGPTHAFAVAKELLNQAAGMDRLDAHLDRELQELVRAADGAECAEGLSAFFEKRHPTYA